MKKRPAVPVIALDDDDFGAILNCAVRYSIGRNTYMPHLVTEFIKPLLPYLNDKTVHCISRDIGSELSKGVGIAESHTWLNFYEVAKLEHEKRTKERITK